MLSKPDGSQVKIKDVGRVELGAQTYDLRARLSKPLAGASPAGAIGIYLAPGANAMKTADNVKQILQDAKERFPPDMDYDVTLDTTLPIKASMDEIVHTLFEAVMLVLIVVYIFLQSFRATIIPMCTVPVSLLGAFIMFPVLGFSVNVLTMFGLVLAIGIVVDDAIVVVEAVQHHLEHGMTPVEATRQAMKEVSGPVVAIGLVLCAVFVPVAGMGGVTGQLYKQFALTIAVAVVFSVINALTLSPALCALMLKKPTPGRGPIAKFFKLFNSGFDWVISRYGTIVGGFDPQGRPLDAAAGGGGGRHLGARQGRARRFHSRTRTRAIVFVAVELPEGASVQRSDALLKQVETIVGNTKGVRSAVGLAGLQHPQLAELPQRGDDVRGARTVGGTQGPRVARQRHRPRVDEEVRRHSRRARVRLRPAAAAGLRQRVGFHHAVAGPFRGRHRATGGLCEAAHRGRRQAASRSAGSAPPSIRQRPR